MSARKDRIVLLRAAKLLCHEIEAHCKSAGVHIKHPKLKVSNTDGWYVVLGTLWNRKLRLDLWLDRYPATEERRFYFGFQSYYPAKIRHLIAQQRKFLQPVRTLTQENFEKMAPKTWLMHPPLRPREFARPLFEIYYGQNCFYGMYESRRSRTEDNISQLVKTAAAFFSQVVWALTPKAKTKLKEKVYPQLERTVVRKHLSRERNSQLARACKRRDGYRCQVCKMTFEEVYGELGREYAQSHHLRPLSRSRANVKTRLEDLVTVCANCHCMLHLMRGHEHDLDKLRHLLKKS